MISRFAVRPYPWSALPSLDGASVAATRDARRALAASFDGAALDGVLTELLGVECRLVVHAADAATALRDLPAVRVSMALADGRARWLVGLDPGLVTAAAALLLRRPLGIEAPSSPVEPALQGAAEAILLEAARRLSRQVAVALAAPPELGPGIAVRASVHLAGRAYSAGAFLRLASGEAPRATVAELCDRLGAAPLTLGLVIGECAAERAELRSLVPGDAWSCGGGLFIDRSRAGRGVLAAPDAARGAEVALASDGSIVLLGGTRALAQDVEEADVEHGTDDADQTLTEAIFDAPVVVRIELGAVAMPAREWVALRPGDVIRTDRRVAEPVVLRVAGREVAQGELVEIDGELAVRVLALVPEGGGK